jgi:Tol biopolymer transport system component
VGGQNSPAPRLDLPNLQRLTDDGYFYRYPAWSPDGRRIAVGRNRSNQTPAGPNPLRWEIVLIDTQTLETQTVSIGDDYSLTSPTWSPDGERLAFTAYDGKLNHLVTYSIVSE